MLSRILRKVIAQMPNGLLELMIKEKDPIEKIKWILIYEGQHSKKFKLGETIKYDPYEVVDLIRKYEDYLK